MNLQFKDGFLLGAATAATQIEGGELGHTWNDWYHRGRIKDGSNPARATDHYNRWKEDADLMASMGLKVYRLGLEWARICPTQDSVDEAVVIHYREELLYLKQKGILPLLTIHHFTNPMWFEALGGFSKWENVNYFIHFVTLVVTRFGDLVSEYITLNEPNVYATHGFYYGSWPPGEKSMKQCLKVMSVMAACHIESYELIHHLREEMGYGDTKVGFAQHMRVFEPANPYNPWHRACTFILDQFFQVLVSKAMVHGVFRWPLRNHLTRSDKKPVGQKAGKGEYCDFIGLNYYSRSTVSGLGDGVRKGTKKNDLGWEIYPEGIVRTAQRLYKLIPRPVYITENGTCDGSDQFRSRYIYEHLQQIMNSDLPIQRYYHWCFCDNFEWAEGESARFGLVHVDYDTQQREVKQSGEFYSAMIREGGVTEEIYDRYVKNQAYHE